MILSFSGHGYTEKDGAFYLLPSDANPDEKIPPTSVPSFISSEELSEWLRNVDAGQMAMIIDACHSAESVQAGSDAVTKAGRDLGFVTLDADAFGSAKAISITGTRARRNLAT